MMDDSPGLESPVSADNGTELITASCRNGKFVLIPVTVSNERKQTSRALTATMLNQLETDTVDFPYLSEFGIHSELELAMTKSITGLSVGEITYNGRPERYSGAGFMAADEDIISVLKGDNRLVKMMGLKHSDLARPLFHLWNIIQVMEYYFAYKPDNCGGLDYLLYNGHKVKLGSGSGHGWQNSIFSDSIRGMYHMNISYMLEEEDRDYFKTKYGQLPAEDLDRMDSLLTHIHTGEMVAYYIMRYGFYEGHTSYRAEPLLLALAFNLVSLEELDSIFDGKLEEVLKKHHTRD